MLPETTTKPSTLSSSDSEGADRHKQLDREIRDMVKTLTHHIPGLQRPAANESHHDTPDPHGDDDDGIRIVTLAGNNSGATMRTDWEDKSKRPQSFSSLGDSRPALDTYVNSNFQAVNNSIMLQSTHNTNDPGVHVDISDTNYEQSPPRPDKKVKKKVDKESFKSDRQSAISD